MHITFEVHCCKHNSKECCLRVFTACETKFANPPGCPRVRQQLQGLPPLPAVCASHGCLGAGSVRSEESSWNVTNEFGRSPEVRVLQDEPAERTSA